MAAAWNHNIHYHDVVLRSVPSNCRRALEVGCGQGLLARQLARHCEQVVAIDVDHGALACARATSASEARIAFVEGDVMTHSFSDGSFDLVTAVASLHHLSLKPALVRFRSLLRPGGILAVVGLYRPHAFGDYALSAAAFPVSWILGCTRQRVEVGAPVQDPRETLGEIRTACDTLLPGAVLQRHLLFRYSLIWRKP
jgi:2-polyprenyl-3-methyl-5-hydroxy-6-metoxy-1,4-benzoquinol methylase